MTTRIVRIAAATFAATFAAALSLAACGEGESPPPASSTPTTTTQSPLDGALWPDPAVAVARTGPREVARSFIVDFLRMENPPLGEFQQGDSRSGEVSVFLRGESGEVFEDRVISTIALRQLDGVRWFVIAAISNEVQIDEPQALAEIASPVTIAGEGRGFESNIGVAVHAAFDPKPLAEAGVSAGDVRNQPFSEKVTFERPLSATGAIVAVGGGGLDGVTHPFSAFPIRFATR